MVTIATQNAQVRKVESTLRSKLDGLADKVFAYLDRIDPDRILLFVQAREIEHLETRLLALGLIIAHVEMVREKMLRELDRLRGQGVEVDPTVVEAVRGCLVERDNGRD